MPRTQCRHYSLRGPWPDGFASCPPPASVLYRRLWSLPTIASFHGLKSPAAMCSRAIVTSRNKKWEDDFSPIDPEGTAFVDTLYTKAYLHHLVTCGEMLAAQIASLHNIAFYLRLVTMAREHIAAGDFRPWKETMVQKLTQRL